MPAGWYQQAVASLYAVFLIWVRVRLGRGSAYVTQGLLIHPDYVNDGGRHHIMERSLSHTHTHVHRHV